MLGVTKVQLYARILTCSGTSGSCARLGIGFFSKFGKRFDSTLLAFDYRKQTRLFFFGIFQQLVEHFRRRDICRLFRLRIIIVLTL